MDNVADKAKKCVILHPIMLVWVNAFPGKALSFKKYGSPNAFETFDPHITVIKAIRTNSAGLWLRVPRGLYLKWFTEFGHLNRSNMLPQNNTAAPMKRRNLVLNSNVNPLSWLSTKITPFLTPLRLWMLVFPQ